MTIQLRSVASGAVKRRRFPGLNPASLPSSLKSLQIRTSLRTLVFLSLIAVPATGRPAAQTQPEPGPQGPQKIPEYVAVRCGRCHAIPEPSMLSKDQWSMVITEFMKSVMKRKADLEYSEQELRNVLAYYRSNSPQRLPKLPPDPQTSKIRFKRESIGEPPSEDSGAPTISHLQIVDLDKDGLDDILVCEGAEDRVSWIRRVGDRWVEAELGKVPAPAHAEVVDFNADGHYDLVVSGLGSLFPNDEPVGVLVLLVNDGQGGFSSRTILKDVGRVADARPGDFDRDGDIDFAVGLFGQIREGGVGWLEQESDGEFTFHMLRPKPGLVHVPTADLDGDGNLDFVALVTQESEEIVAFLGDGKGGFREQVVFGAGTPLFGSSGMSLVDLDQDGDLDILYTNGDSFDLVRDGVPFHFLLRPYHGVRWLENVGRLRFDRHDIMSYYGAFGAVAGDLDGDEDLDVMVVSTFNDWTDPTRQSVVWLENDGKQQFTAHGIGSNPSHQITAALGDLDGDGRLDAVTGGMHVTTPYDRIGRVTLWRNQGANPTTP